MELKHRLKVQKRYLSPRIKAQHKAQKHFKTIWKSKSNFFASNKRNTDKAEVTELLDRGGDRPSHFGKGPM